MKNKILLLIILATVNLLAVSQKSMEYYVKKYIEKKTNSPVNKIKTISSYVIDGTNGWRVYFLQMDVNVKISNHYENKKVNKIAFTKGSKITFSLKDTTGKDYSKALKPKVPKSAYNKEHLLVGDENAEHKILIFSDPFCPYCQEIIPPLMDAVKANPKTFALYYYHLPLLRIHPASDTVTKAMHLFQKRGELSKVKACYHLLVSERERSPKVVLDAIKAKTGEMLSLSQINEPEIINALAFDKVMKKRLMVTGTPTVFIDGKWDPTRFKYKEYLPKK